MNFRFIPTQNGFKLDNPTKFVICTIYFPFHKPEPNTNDPTTTAPKAKPYFQDNGLATTPAAAPFLTLERSLTVGVDDEVGDTEDVLNPDKSDAVTEDGATTLEWTRRLLVVILE